MNMLLTAFKGKHNSSYQLLQEFEGNKLFLTNSFTGLEKDIRNYDCREHDAVMLFGVDPKLKVSVRIEAFANGNAGIKESALNICAVAELFENYGIKNYIAKHATNYLCNYAYYLMLDKMCGKAVLIHIPPEKYLTDDLKEKLVCAINKCREPDFGNEDWV